MNTLQMITNFLLILAVTALYGLIHSLLASKKAKVLASDWMGSRYSWYRLAYNIFAFITLLPLLAVAVTLPDKAIYSLPAPWSWLFLLLQLAGLIFAIMAVFQTGFGQLSGLRQLVEKPGEPSTGKLETGGLYRLVRHPIYTGSILFLWAAPELTWNGLALKAAFTLYFIVGGIEEEKKLVEEFGEEYRSYRMKTPMIIPWIKKST